MQMPINYCPDAPVFTWFLIRQEWMGSLETQQAVLIVWALEQIIFLYPLCPDWNPHSPEKSVSDCALRALGGRACWSAGWSEGSQGCGHHLEVHMLIRLLRPVWREIHLGHPATMQMRSTGLNQHLQRQQGIWELKGLNRYLQPSPF